jgi:hypothetical protein
MNFLMISSKHLKYEFHIHFILVFYAKLIWWNIIRRVAENISDVFPPLTMVWISPKSGWKYIRCFPTFDYGMNFNERGFSEFQQCIGKQLKRFSEDNVNTKYARNSHVVTFIRADNVLRSTMAHLPRSMIRPITHFTWLRSTNSMDPKSS